MKKALCIFTVGLMLVGCVGCTPREVSRDTAVSPKQEVIVSTSGLSEDVTEVTDAPSESEEVNPEESSVPVEVPMESATVFE